ncbi:chemotaxis protein CheW [Peribacillus sp. SCS-155]|uniref:chemotaxis protein CheW n=1 Tax=Peribacillus sedimenti TaxID=3115297 RepID=UPI0039061959
MDVAQVLYETGFESNEESKIILVYFRDLSIGLVVEEATQILDVDHKDLRGMDGVISSKINYVTGVMMTERGFVTLLNPDELFLNLGEIDAIRKEIVQIDSLNMEQSGCENAKPINEAHTSLIGFFS